MDNDDKKHINSFYKAYRNGESESTFSGLQQDIINTQESELRKVWSSKYIKAMPLRECR